MSFNKYIVSQQTTVLETMRVINKGAKGIAYICDNGFLQAVVTDGDIRRFILNQGCLSDTVATIANYKVKYISINSNISPKHYMQENAITSVPIVDAKGKLISIEFLYGERLYKNDKLNIPVVIMAGGKGTRLLPYTQVLPKPLIPIGDKTITEHIMNKFMQFSCKQFYMIVNYKRELIKAYFKEQDYKQSIEFVDEVEFLGTGGGLYLLKDKISSTFFMTNCDVLIKDDYSAMLEYHKNNNNIITIICAAKQINIPYGTIKVGNDGNVTALEEKPSINFITNTGMYIIEPKFLEYIQADTFIHITDVIEKCIKNKEKIGVYPISENAWMDMGEMNELDKMLKGKG